MEQLTKQLEELEEELDAAESTLTDVNSKLHAAETTADESERYDNYILTHNIPKANVQ